MKLHYAGFQPNATGFGWATCNANLRRELGKRFELVEAPLSEVVFMPLADHDFNPVSPARGKINLAYTFFEFPLGPNAAANAKKYDIVFCGSTWCLNRMREHGITNGRLLIQGVDQEIFFPSPGRKQDDEFRIFSGGKFEYRKGQDLVIAAFKEFAKTHPEAHLVCSWFNPWPQLLEQELKRIDPDRHYFGEQTAKLELLMLKYFDKSQFTILPQLSQTQLAKEMRNTDCGLFPNRCEGGTNLVLMEYAACGRSVIANQATGHADIADLIHFPIPFAENSEHWAKQDVEDIVKQLECAYQYDGREVRVAKKRTWADTADTIMAALAELKQNATVAA